MRDRHTEGCRISIGARRTVKQITGSRSAQKVGAPTIQEHNLPSDDSPSGTVSVYWYSGSLEGAQAEATSIDSGRTAFARLG